MLFSLLTSAASFLMSPPDDPEGGGSGTSVQDPPNTGEGAKNDPPPPPPQETFTPSDMAQMRRKYEREMLKRDKELEEQKRKIEELTSKVSGNSNPEPSTPSTEGGKVELLEKRIRDQQTKYEEQLAQVNAEKEKVLLELRNSNKNHQLQQALNGKVVDMTGAIRYFRDNIVWDELEERHFYKTSKGNLTEIKDGIEAEMPDWLRLSKANQGGSGSGGSTPRGKVQHQRDLEAAKKKLEELQVAARKDPSDANLLSYQRQKRAVARLEQETQL